MADDGPADEPSETSPRVDETVPAVDTSVLGTPDPLMAWSVASAETDVRE